MKKALLIIGIIASLNTIWAEDTQNNVTTPKGSTVIAWIRDEMSASSIAQAEAEVRAIYPNAEILEAASRTYNCHGYAWCMSENGPTRWIGMSRFTGDDSNTHEDIYMTDGSYTQVTAGIGPRKVCYYTGDHSAVTSDESGIFISKWGEYPLMRHAPNDCYYNASDLRYFVKTSLMTINGSNSVSSSAQTYTLSYTPAGTINWTVSSNLQIISGQGTPSISVKSNGVGNGTISVSMTHNFAGQNVTTSTFKNVTVGVPDPNLIDVTIGGQSSNYTLFIYQSGRNECIANYQGAGGNSSILEYEWEATGFEVHNELTANKSRIYLRATSTSISSMVTVSVRARNSAGWGEKKLVGANVNSSSGYSIISSSDGILTIEPNETLEYSLLRPTENIVSGSIPYEVYNLYTGALVANGNISREGGTINLSHLPKGIYVFSLRINDDLRQTLRISIRH